MGAPGRTRGRNLECLGWKRLLVASVTLSLPSCPDTRDVDDSVAAVGSVLPSCTLVAGSTGPDSTSTCLPGFCLRLKREFLVL